MIVVVIVGVTGTQYDRIRGYPILGGCRSGGGGIRLITIRSRRRGGGGRILHRGGFSFCKGIILYIVGCFVGQWRRRCGGGTVRSVNAVIVTLFGKNKQR